MGETGVGQFAEWTLCRTATLPNVVDKTSREKPVSKTCVQTPETCGNICVRAGIARRMIIVETEHG